MLCITRINSWPTFTSAVKEKNKYINVSEITFTNNTKVSRNIWGSKDFVKIYKNIQFIYNI